MQQCSILFQFSMESTRFSLDHIGLLDYCFGSFLCVFASGLVQITSSLVQFNFISVEVFFVFCWS